MDVSFSNVEKIAILEASGYVVIPAVIVVKWRVKNLTGSDELYGYKVEDQFGEEFCRPEESAFATDWLDKAFEACLRKMMSVLTAGEVKEVRE